MLRIALAQINPTVGDLEGNTQKIADYIEQARRYKADIVVFPELALTGYPPEDLLLKEHFVRDNLKSLELLRRETLGITAIVGFVDMDKDKKIYNAAAVLHDGKIAGVYHKNDLPNYGVFDEKRYFTVGKTNTVFQCAPVGTGLKPVPTKGDVTFGITICEDIWNQDGPHRAQVKAGAKILINLSSSPYHAGKSKEREKMLIARARENKAFVCYVNLVGGQDELVFDGASCVINPDGKIVARGRQFEEDLVLADIDVGAARQVNSGAAPAKDVKRIILSTGSVKKNRMPISKNIHQPLNPVEEIYRALVLGTRDYIVKNGFKKIVIGLSGGIDSSLVAVIACDAIGKDNVVGISMPSRFTSEGTRTDARKLADNLGIEFKEISIEPLIKSYAGLLRESFANTRSDITEENLQARIRGNILMAFSNKFGWLVLTTGNKSELATGYCTLYGDMAGGFAVIKDVPKTTVYQVARFRNDRDEKKPIPESIFTRPPTAELSENQKDEDSLPPYAVLDPIITDYVELDKSFSDLSKKSHPETVKKVVLLIDKSEYKRRQAPPGVKITPRAFGRDRRLPITNRYKEY